MADGFVLIEVNDKGDMRVMESEEATEINYIDFRLMNLDIDNDFILECVGGDLPGNLRDVLVLCTFRYESVGGGGYFGDDYEDNFILENHVILRENYKEFVRLMITEELQMAVYDYESPPEFYSNLVAGWEEFYDTGFEPAKTNRQTGRPLVWDAEKSRFIICFDEEELSDSGF